MKSYHIENGKLTNKQIANIYIKEVLNDDATEIPIETLINFMDLNRFGEYLRYSSEVKELKGKTIFYR